MHKAKNGKPFTVGIMAGSFHTEYSKMIVDTICEQLRDEDIQVYLFQGLDAARYLNFNAYVDDSFDRHYYSLFEYSKYVELDLMIISYGTISAVPSPLSQESLLKRLPKVPFIMVEDDKELPGGTFIVVDNYGGMKSCVEHLITEHGAKKIVYVSGPHNVPDSIVRLNAYEDTLKEHGIYYDDNYIVYGDFTDLVDSLVEDLLMYVPDADAIVCANDEMAQSAYRVAEAKGKKVGKDILITGFDNNATAQYMNPPLTTVEQDLSLVARTVADAVGRTLRGEKIESIRIPAKLILRGSCGCTITAEAGEEDDAGEVGRVYEERLKIKQLQNDNIISSLILRGVITRYICTEPFFTRLGQILHRIGTRRSYIALLPEPLFVKNAADLVLPDELLLFMSQHDDEIRGFSRETAPRISLSSLQEHMGERVKHKQMAAFPLFFGETHYGVFYVELARDAMLFFYTLSLEIGTGIGHLLLSLNMQKANKELEEKNNLLDYSATHDALTGLYNRHGVWEKAGSILGEQTADEDGFAVMMADLDHLKQINDTFGHEAGDDSIKKTADILREVLPADCIIGRIGGDEFLCVLPGQTASRMEDFRTAIAEKCEEYNAISQKPYYLGISTGVNVQSIRETVLSAAMKRADERLYEAKKNRRASVIREK